MNKWIGSGKVSGDPIIKYDGDKASFIAFTIMVKRNRRIKEGDQPVDFIDCICTGHNARIVEKYLYKERKLKFAGRCNLDIIQTKRAGKYTQRQYMQRKSASRKQKRKRKNARRGNAGARSRNRRRLIMVLWRFRKE